MRRSTYRADRLPRINPEAGSGIGNPPPKRHPPPPAERDLYQHQPEMKHGRAPESNVHQWGLSPMHHSISWENTLLLSLEYG